MTAGPNHAEALGEAMDHAMAAAETAAQATAAIWNRMTPQEQGSWFLSRCDRFPDVGPLLIPVVAAAKRESEDR